MDNLVSARVGGVPSRWRFTGQEEEESGLVYMHARYYDPVTGQFISPDTIVPEPGKLLSYNRYLYARADPLSYNDPSGHEPLNPDPDVYPCSYVYCEWSNFTLSWEVVSQPTGNYGRFLRTPEELSRDTQAIFFVVGFLDPGIIDGTQAVGSLQSGDYLGATIAAAALLPLGDFVKAARIGDKALQEAARLLPPIDMQDAVEAAAEMAGDGAKWIETPAGNYQFQSIEVDANGNHIARIGRLDVDLATQAASREGSHLNLEYQVNGTKVVNYHIAIDSSSVRRGDYR